MRPSPDAPFIFGKALGACLRAVRKHRRLDQIALAEALRMSRRKYIAIENGVGRMSAEDLIAFADATDSDRFALVAATVFEKPGLAVQCADNKLMTVMMIAADDFEAVAAGALAAVRPQEAMSAFEAAFARLRSELEQRQAEDRRFHSRPPTSPDNEDDA